MYRIAVVDDDKLCLEIFGAMLEQYSTDYPAARVRHQRFSSPFDLLDAVEEGTEFDLYLLDVMMPGMSGISVASELRRKEIGVPIIFISTEKQFALDAFKVEAANYLIKGFSYAEFRRTLDKSLQITANERRGRIILSTRNGYRHIFCRTIMYSLANKNYQTIVLETGEELEVRMSHKALTEKLVDSISFVEVGSSYVVNMFYISELTDETITMFDQFTLQIPRRQKKKILESYESFIVRIDQERLRMRNAKFQ